MPITPTAKIWHNGNLVPWEKAQIHVMSHVVHYGSSVFEGIRCYAQPQGAAIFRLPEHMQRLLDSAKIYRMPAALLAGTAVERGDRPGGSNGVAPCYIRPIALRGYGEMGVSPKGTPIEVFIANYSWGKYVPGDEGADVCISSWNRMAPNTLPALAKAGGNYLNSQLIRMEADSQWLLRRDRARCFWQFVGRARGRTCLWCAMGSCTPLPGEFGAVWDYSGFRADDGAAPGHSGGGTGYAAGAAVYRG